MFCSAHTPQPLQSHPFCNGIFDAGAFACLQDMLVCMLASPTLVVRTIRVPSLSFPSAKINTASKISQEKTLPVATKVT